MFNAEAIKKTLSGRIGWRETIPVTRPDGSTVPVSDKNKESRSGRHFQDFHQIVTLRNTYDNIEIENANAAQFNEYLENLQDSAIMGSVSAVLDADSLIEQSLIFSRRSDKSTSTQRVSTKMGYKISIAQNPSYCSVIKNASLLFAESGEVELIFTHSNHGELQRKKITVEANIETVIPIDLPLFYSCDKYKGGFFFVYFETNLLPVEPECPDFNKTGIFRAEPFEGDDLNNISFTSRTYGLNLEICAYRDFTHIIKNSPSVFDTLIGLQMAATVIELMINSTRSNHAQRLTGEAAGRLYADLNQMYPSPEFPYSTGIRGQIAREIKRVTNNLLPKQKSQIVTPCFT